MKLINRSVKRLFAFGCSFTKYHWATWPEILGYDLKIPVYNYGRSGAGNQYISNMVSQADSIYNFTENDLIIVSWTNVSREDRWVNGNWITPGNIFTQATYDEKFVSKWVDPVGNLNRDLSLIKLTKGFLENKNCQFHFLSMCDIVNQLDQNHKEFFISEAVKEQYKKLIELYKNELSFLQSSFFKILWNNNIVKNKFNIENLTYFSDGHPNPEEHYRYLREIFKEHVFQGSTSEAVQKSQENFLKFIEDMNQYYKRNWVVYELNSIKNKEFYDKTKISNLESVEFV